MLIIITFPNRTLSWFQIGSVAVSSFMTLWTAANLFQLKLEKENRETMFVRALKKVRTFSLTAPLREPFKNYLADFSVKGAHGTRTCIKRKKIDYGKFFDFCAEKCVYN